jgi:hypothetical protein
MSPIIDNPLIYKDLSIFIKFKPSIPPIAIYQNLQKGKKKSNLELTYAEMMLMIKNMIANPVRIYNDRQVNFFIMIFMRKGQKI